MADEAFALSLISARAAQPREEDYDAISEAFMETSRGRWFLGEYAKRNRNTDTRMVLDAVARIEQSLAAQKQPEPEPIPDTGLADALSAIKAALNEAQAAASAAVDNLALEQHLAPVRKGARVIREISWRWREIGADGRICDLLDSQVSAIEASCGQISSADPRTALSAAFDLIGSSIATFDEDGDAPDYATVETTAEAAASPSPAPSNEMPAVAALQPPAQAEAPANEAEAAVASQVAPAPALPVEEAIAETIADVDAMEVAPEASDLTAETIAPIADPAAELTPEAADAHDEAVLDLIAAEMAAPDDSDDDFGNEPAGMPFDDPPSSEPEMMAAPHETTVAPQIVPAMAPAASPVPQAAIEPAPAPSLGSTLLANGFLRKPAPAVDPLAAIRRLSQIEKIALFS